MVDQGHATTLLMVQASSTMKPLQANVQGGVAGILRGLARLPGMNSVSVAAFAGDVTFETEFEQAGGVNFAVDPRGDSALCDSVASAIVGFHEKMKRMPEHARPRFVQVMLIADGSDVASRTWSPELIRILVNFYTNQLGWDFRLIALTPEAEMIGDEMAFKVLRPDFRSLISSTGSF